MRVVLSFSILDGGNESLLAVFFDNEDSPEFSIPASNNIFKEQKSKV